MRKVGTRKALPTSSTRGVKGRATSLGFRLGRDQAIWSRICIQNQHDLVRSHSACIWCWDKPWPNSDSLDSPWPRLGGSHHLPPTALCRGYIQMTLFPRTPKLESRNYPEIVPVEVPELWELISPDFQVRLERGLNQYCSSPPELFNAMSHSRCKRRKEVDSRLFVFGSQIASLTPGPSFAHNLGCRCPNGQMRGHFRHLHFKTFPMTPITSQCEVFWPFNSSSEFSGVLEDSKFPVLGVWASPSHLAQSGVAT